LIGLALGGGAGDRGGGWGDDGLEQAVVVLLAVDYLLQFGHLGGFGDGGEEGVEFWVLFLLLCGGWGGVACLG